MTSHKLQKPRHRSVIQAVVVTILACFASVTSAQEVRYSWLDIAYLAQDVDRSGTQQTPIPGQFVDAEVSDGKGIRFRASLGTWHNLYTFVDYGSTDIDIDVVVTNPQGQTFPASDQFDLTQVRGGVGLRFPLRFNIDLYGEVSFDSLDFDFGSFAGEDFDGDNQDIGGAIGVRAMLNDDFEVRVHGRYTSNADFDLTTSEFDSGSVFGAGFGWQLIRGFSIVADYESGEFSRWSIGFRLDLDED